VRNGFMGTELGILLGHSTADSEPTLIFTCAKDAIRLSPWEQDQTLLRADRLIVVLGADAAAKLSLYLGIYISNHGANPLERDVDVTDGASEGRN
jgi:hypothetical protein